MNCAVVTGASSGIGLAISKLLVDIGYKVYGLARDFSKTMLESPHFIKKQCDLKNVNQLICTVKEIKSMEKSIHILVNNAGIGFFGPHEQLKPAQIEAMVATNLQAPLIMTNLLLREIKSSSGYIINISSITAKKSSTYGCAYAATKAGLSHFAASLFDEVRKTGTKVITIHPDITRTDFYNNLDFSYGEDPQSFITPEAVADSVRFILTQPEGTLVPEITLRPQKHLIAKKGNKAPNSKTT